MIVNRYPGKCQSCNIKLGAGDGFAYKNGYKWFSVCPSTACHKRLGVTAPVPETQQSKTLSEDGFVTMPYDRDAIDLLRSLPGARWNPERKQWSCSLIPENLPRVIEIADQLQLEVPQSLRKKLAEGTPESRAAITRAEQATRTDGKKLYPFQIKGVEFLALHERALLGDDMGLGKSVQTLVALPDNAPVILICPAAVKYNWRDEARLWRTDYSVEICNGKNSFVFPKPGQIVILNYDILPKWLAKDEKLTEEQVNHLKETILVCDEAHLVKNYKSLRSQRVSTLSKICKRVWFLTGTPLMNRPTDLYGVVSAGNMNVLGNWNKFLTLFDGYKNQWGGYEFGQPKTEVPERMKRVMLRRLRTEVLPDLPRKVYQNLEINDLGAALEKQLNDFVIANAVAEGLIDIEDVDKSLLKNTARVTALASKLEMNSLPSFEEFSAIRALLAKARIPTMLEMVESYEDSNTPLVVFSAHKAPILELQKREGWDIITGETKSEDRRNIVQKFQSGALKGIALTIQAGGVGITLTHASHALFVDLDWTPALNIQAEDRICRIGATADKVLIIRMVSSHPLDQHMQKLINYKMELIYRALEASINFKPPKVRPKTQDIIIIEETEDELAERIRSAESEVTREMSLNKLRSIAGREAAKVSDIPEPELTLVRKDHLRKALDYMVSRCDGAYTKDGQGFNRPDAAIGHWIFNTGLRDDDDMAFRVLERILVRYRRQLKDQFEVIWKPDL